MSTRSRTPLRRLAGAATAVVALVATALPAAAAPKPTELAGTLARVDARIMFETVVGCEDGDTTCLCTHLGTAKPKVRTPDGTKVTAGRIPVAVLAPCGSLGDRVRVRGEVALLTASRGAGKARMTAGGGEMFLLGAGIGGLVAFGTTPATWVPGDDARIVFAPEDEAAVTIAYEPGSDGYAWFGPDEYLKITMENNLAAFVPGGAG